MSDDAVDDGIDKAGAVLDLRDRLDLVYQGRPRNACADRAFTAVVEAFDMPRALPEALLEGFAWDAVGRRYDTLSGVLDYSARVAAAIAELSSASMTQLKSPASTTLGVSGSWRGAKAADTALE